MSNGTGGGFRSDRENPHRAAVRRLNSQCLFQGELVIGIDDLFDGDEVLDIRLPAHVNLEVSHTEPGVKGNTATGGTKPATVETNFTLQVPLFVDIGDILKIDTRSGEYIERVKS